ncbi:MAG: aminotransferase class I/II-fold pyridoxal phosphate-dependent enzyme [Fusobacteriaceae bacterium]|nr:aminotransferase class I/II-fold pyridoxal phosphate-dependent enzyme [Fusobacteriaceae bacterium]
MRPIISNKFAVMSRPMGAARKTESNLPFINLGIGDLDITTDETVIEKAMADAKAGYTHYTDPQGLLDLRTLISDYHKKCFTNYEFEPKDIFVTTSASHGLYLTMLAILNEGDEVILLAPYFPLYELQIRANGGTPVVVQTKFENNFQLVKEDIEAAITPKTKAVIMNTPGNPSGVCYNRQSLEILRDLAVKYDLLVVADEVYDYYSYDTAFIPAVTIEGMRDRCISVCSYSKNFAMTGWRIGYVISVVDRLVEVMEYATEPMVYSAPAPSQRAAYHAMTDYERIRAKNVPIFRERIDYCYDRIAKMPKLSCFKSQGGIYLFPNVRGTGMSGKEFSDELFKKYNVNVIDGAGFGTPDFVRIACTLDLGRMKEAFDRIEEFLK